MKYSIRNLRLFLLVLAAVFAVKAQENAKDSADKTVFLNATVASEREFLKDLTAKDFEIYEGKRRREITFFKREGEPASVGVLFDVSSSMRDAQTGRADKISFAARGFNSLLENAHPENDYFFISFGRKVSVLLEPTTDKNKVGEVLKNLAVFRPVDAETGLFEAAGAALEKISRTSRQKKILILITDGMYNNSKKASDFGDIRKLFRSGDVLLYTINILMDTEFWKSSYSRPGEIRSLDATIPPLAVRNLRSFFLDTDTTVPYVTSFSSADNLEILASETGGRAFYPISMQETVKTFEMLADELKSQYILGFQPLASAKKDEWRKVEVKVNLPKERRKETGRIFVRARTGFYF